MRGVSGVSGKQLVFDIESVSLLDINRLIDADRRFMLLPASEAEEQEFDDLEEYYGYLGTAVSET